MVKELNLVVGIATGIFTVWQVSRYTSPKLQSFMYQHFSLSQTYTVNEKHYHTIFTYGISHSNPVHFAVNAACMLAAGRFVPKDLLFKFYLMSVPMGVVGLAVTPSAEAQTVRNMPSTKGSGAYSAALLTYYGLMSKHSFYGIPAWSFAVAGITLEAMSSVYLGRNQSVAPEVSGAFCALYYIFLKFIKII